jgi:2-phospho-L-lactate guanylyltransferase
VTFPDTPSAVPAFARIAAIVPVGYIEGAKSRLGAVLDAEERRDLVLDLLERTVAAVVASPGIAEVIVITPDDEVREVALDLGARPLRQDASGLNSGIRQARAEAIAADADAILIIPIDLPWVTPDAIATITDTLVDHAPPLVAIVPDRHGRGTNALLLAPPAVIDVQFGGDSRSAHAAAAADAGATLIHLDGPIAMDIDTPEDLLLAQTQVPPGAHVRG